MAPFWKTVLSVAIGFVLGVVLLYGALAGVFGSGAGLLLRESIRQHIDAAPR